MQYKQLGEIYNKLEATSKRLEKTSYVAELIEKTANEDLPMIMLLLEGRLYPKYEAEKKIGVAGRLVIKAINVATGIEAHNIEQEWKKTGDLGKVAENFTTKKKQATLVSHHLSVEKVFANLQKLAELEGPETVEKKVQMIAELLTSAAPLEAKYIVRTILEDLRVGVGAGSIRDAIVWSEMPQINNLELTGEGNKYYFNKTLKAEKIITALEDVQTLNIHNVKAIEAQTKELAREIYNYFVKTVEEAYNVNNDWAKTIIIIRKKGLKGLEETDIELGKPIKVMLYQKAKDLEEAFEMVGKPAILEYKYDGFRLQIEILEKNNIILYTRNFEDVTAQFPDVIGAVKQHISVKTAILEAECVGFDAKTKRYLPFQNVSQRIKRKYDIEEIAKKFPVEVNIFDIIYLNGNSMIEKPFEERRKALEKIITPKKGKIKLSEAMVTDNLQKATDFYKEALEAGNEGVMAKNLVAHYKPGSRVGFGVKVKPVMESLDLVIVKAEYGEGKRAGWLTSFTLACRDDNGDLFEIGKISTGLKELDEEGTSYNYMTELLKPLIKEEQGKEVILKPRIIMEVSFEEIQKSTNYASGYALRFPRFVRLREDRNEKNASSLSLVEQLYNTQRSRAV
ncbi:ATP-dependent DNA ligase [Candidatus Woesearchaeota archaeon]|nr:ATP-dependent DNA ligase [Candidatus Woesearchaeota archaeon]